MVKIIFFTLFFLTTLPLCSMDSKPVNPKKKDRISRAINLISSRKQPRKKEKKSVESPNQVTPSDKIIVGSPITELPFSLDFLGILTNHLCENKNQCTKRICKKIIQLSWICRELYHYYSNITTIKQMIRTLSKHHNKSDLYVAGILNKQVKSKMLNLLEKVIKDKPFTEDDLKDTWYLNTTFSTMEGDGKINIYTPHSMPILLIARIPYPTLLSLATFRLDVEKVKAMINAGITCNHNRYSNPIAALAVPYISYETTIEQQKKNTILKLLLEAKINPDSRCEITMPTCLYTAVQNRDKERARLLLEYGANPYALYFEDHYKQEFDYETYAVVEWQYLPFQEFKKIAYDLPLDTEYRAIDNSKEPWKQNAFHWEQGEPKGWLKTMYDEIQAKNNSHS